MPGSNYTRNITIYINGKQVSNDIKSIRGEMRHLINAQAKMTRGSKEYVKAGQEIKKLDGILANHRKSLKTTSNSIVSTLKNYAIGFFGVSAAIRIVTRVIGDAIRVNREFESSFSNVLTLLDQAQKQQFGKILERGVIDLMAEFGFEIKDINQALFDVISNGVPAGEAIDFLRKNAELAIGGVSSLSATVKGTTKLMNTYGIEAENAGEITSALFAAQVKGATTVELLSDNVGKLAAIAAQSNIPMNEMLATFAGLTKQLDGTEESATALRQVIASIIKPTEEAKGIYKELGINVGQTALQQDGLLNKLLEVAAAAEGNQDVLSDLIPNIRAFSGISSLSAETIAELEQNIADLNDKEKSAALLQGAMNEKMQDGERQGKMLRGEWNKLLIKVGGGESIFKRIGTAIRIELTDRIQRAQKAVTVLSEGKWTDKLKLAINTVLRLMAKVLTPLLTIIEKITGKRFELNIEIPEEEKQQIVKTAQEITTELTEEEKARQAKLAAIRKAAAELSSAEEKEKLKKKAESEAKARKDSLDALLKIQDDYYASLATKNEKEIEDIQRKYEKEIEAAMEAKMGKEHIAELEVLMNNEINDAILKQQKERQDAEDKAEREFQEKKTELKKQYNLLSQEELMALEIENLQKFYDGKLLSEEEFQIAKQGIEDFYRQEKERKEQESWQRELSSRIEQAAAINAAISLGLETVMTMRDSELKQIEAEEQKELELAKENSQKQTQIREKYNQQKIAIEKKYADKEFVIKIGQINASTAQAIMSVWGNNTLPYPFAAIFNGIMTAIIAANGIAQAVKAKRERDTVSQLASGKYPVRGADDGKLYNANAIGPVTRSGMQNAGRPALINEKGGEIIFTAPHSRQLMLRPALFNQVMSLPQRAEGNYPRQQLSGNDYDNLTGEINRLNDSITKLVKKSNRSYIVFQDIENAINEVDDIADYAKV